MLIGLLAAGCVAGVSGTRGRAPLTPLQRAAMQTRELEGDFDTVFAATISVLQDTGWQIDEVDKDSGIIQASSLKRQGAIGPEDDARATYDPQVAELQRQHLKGKAAGEWTRWERLTAHLEPWGASTVRERISIVKCGGVPGRTVTQKEPRFWGLGSRKRTVQEPSREQSVILENPRAYQALFQQIQKAIFIRQGLSGE